MKECENVSVRECECEKMTFEHRRENKSCSACQERVRECESEFFKFLIEGYM